MATFLSTPYQGSKYIPTIPLDILSQGMAYKQKQTDEFRAQQQGVLDEIGKNTFYRDSDLNYVNNKLKDAVDGLNNFSGQDLTDGRVQSQITSLVSGVSGDPEVTKRIIANKQRAKSVNDMMEIKEKHPDLWNYQNYQNWKDQDDAWKSDPNKIDYTATYQPYTDTHKYDEEGVKDIMANPIVKDQIMYYTDANGNKIQRGDREVSEVTAHRLKDALLSGMPDNVRGQHQIEYSNFVKGITPEMAAQMAKGETDLYQGMLDQVNSIRNDKKATPDQLATANQMASIYEKAIAHGNNVTNDLRTGTKSVGDYYTFNKYLDKKYQDIANAHAFSKEGKFNYDELYLENVKAQHARELEKLKHGLKMQENASILNNDFVNGVSHAMVDNNATVNANTAADLLGLTGKQDDQGYFNLPLNNTEVHLNVAPLIRTTVPEVDNRKAQGQQVLKEGFSQYIKQHPAGQQIASSMGEAAPNGGYWASPKPQSEHTTSTPTFDEYLTSVKSDANTVNKFQSQYGINLNNPKDLEDSKKAQVAIAQSMTTNQGTMFNKGAGNLRITTTSDAGNLFRGTDGEMHVAVTAVATWDQLTAALGYSPDKLQGSAGSPNAIMPTGTKDKASDKPLYSMPVIIKVNGDIMSKFNENLSNHAGLGAGELKDQRADLTNQFGNKLNMMRMASQTGYQDVPTSTLANEAIKKIQLLNSDPKVVSEATQKINKAINILNSNPAPEVKAQIYLEFNKIFSAKPGDKL